MHNYIVKFMLCCYGKNMLWSYYNAKSSVDYEIREFTQKKCESSFNLYIGRKFLSKFLMLKYLRNKP